MKQEFKQVERQLAKIAALLVCLEDIYHSYESVQQSEKCKRLVYEFAAVFHTFGQDAKRESMYDIFNVDSLFDALPKSASKFDIEKRGMESFQVVAGALYDVLNSSKDAIAEETVKPMLPAIKKIEENAEAAKAFAESKKGFARTKANKQAKECQQLLVQARKQVQTSKNKSLRTCKDLLLQLKHFYLPGAIHSRFMKQVNA